MELPIAVPSNKFLELQPDRQWPQVLRALLGTAILLLLALGMIGWPRLKSTTLSYDILRLRTEVSELERVERNLSAELEAQRSPLVLGEHAKNLGLAPPALADITSAPAARSTDIGREFE